MEEGRVSNLNKSNDGYHDGNDKDENKDNDELFRTGCRLG